MNNKFPFVSKRWYLLGRGKLEDKAVTDKEMGLK